MNITIKENNSYNITMMGKPSRFSLKNFKQKILDKIPTKDIKDVNKYDKWEKSKNWMSNPATNRAIMGCTALITQPVIDYYNSLGILKVIKNIPNNGSSAQTT